MARTLAATALLLVAAVGMAEASDLKTLIKDVMPCRVAAARLCDRSQGMSSDARWKCGVILASHRPRGRSAVCGSTPAVRPTGALGAVMGRVCEVRRNSVSAGPRVILREGNTVSRIMMVAAIVGAFAFVVTTTTGALRPGTVYSLASSP